LKSCRRNDGGTHARGGRRHPGISSRDRGGTKSANAKSIAKCGRQYLLEEALPRRCLVEAWRPTAGAPLYRSSARQFNPVMAAAAKLTIVQSQHIVELAGAIRENAHAGNLRNPCCTVPYGDRR